LLEEQDLKIVRDLVTRHAELTGSRRAKWILDNWRDAVSRFIKVFPHEYKRVLGVARRQETYIPAQIVPIMAAAELFEEEMQQRHLVNGQVLYGQVLNG
jgi:hypothetical protein